MTADQEEHVTITKSKYESLLRDSSMLGFLEQYGVDNWQGYDEAKCDWREANPDA